MKAKGVERSLIWTVILIVVMTILSEISSGFKGFLVSITGHHWVSKGLIALVVFLILKPALAKKGNGKMDVLAAATRICWTVTISSIIIFLYFLIHYLS